jgi:hypothetical protein
MGSNNMGGFPPPQKRSRIQDELSLSGVGVRQNMTWISNTSFAAINSQHLPGPLEFPAQGTRVSPIAPNGDFLDFNICNGIREHAPDANRTGGDCDLLFDLGAVVTGELLQSSSERLGMGFSGMSGPETSGMGMECQQGSISDYSLPVAQCPEAGDWLMGSSSSSTSTSASSYVCYGMVSHLPALVYHLICNSPA